MASVQYHNINSSHTAGVPHVIIVGAGPVGIRFAHEYLRQQQTCKVTVIGNEAYEPYNRVQLSHLLSRSKDYQDIIQQLPLSTEQKSFQYLQAHVAHVDAYEKKVRTWSGEEFRYDSLVLATGSSPHIPNIDGVGLKGVYTFRNLRDTEALLARRHRSRRIVVVGGGLLGLEAAKALRCDGTEVVLVQQSERLMNRQLDDNAASHLQQYVEALGIRVITSSGVRKIIRDGQEPSAGEKEFGRVTAVVTRDQEVITCDTVLLCTGIKPNVQLAFEVGIAFGRGITVNDCMETSIQHIYAIGECCEHNGVVYGIVSPGLEQAAVLANHLSGGQARYHGTELISTLKVVGESVTSMGEIAEVTQRIHQKKFDYYHKKMGAYRSIVVHRGYIVGACSIGEWPEMRRVQEAFLAKKYFYPWQRWSFFLTGKLWFSEGKQSPVDWPETAIVCQCNQISRGVLSEAIDHGCSSLTSLGKDTGAGTVCGSCQPLLQNLLGTYEKPIPMIGGRALTVFSVIAALIATVLVLMPGMAPEQSVQTPSIEFLWTDGFWKQVSGFSLLGLVTIGLIMTLRKRAKWTFLGNFSYWRVVHSVLGALALGVLFIHTGAHLGENLNKWLMINFLLVSLVGAVAGIAMSIAAKTSASAVHVIKRSSFWAHILIVWPLPALLGAHILSVYYF